MKIHFLGTNGWYTDENGNTACVLIDAKDHYVIFDAGNGLYKLDRYITEDKPVSLFISHFHLDHVNGFHILGKFNFKKGLTIYVGEGRKKDFETLVNPPFTVGINDDPKNILNLPMHISVSELPDGSNDVGFPVEVIEQFHGFRDHGYRVMIDGKTIAYSGDCGITDASHKLAENADVLIHECSYKEPKENDPWGHVDPTQAANLAKDAKVKQLILTHFGPTDYKTLDDRKIAERKAREIFPQTIAAVDDLVFDIV